MATKGKRYVQSAPDAQTQQKRKRPSRKNKPHIGDMADPDKRYQRLSRDMVEKALQDNCGLVSRAAVDIGCSRRAIYNYIDRNPEVKQIIESARAELCDMAEDVIAKSLEHNNVGAAMWVLSTLGKNRGYVQRSEVSGAEGGAIEVTVTRKIIDKREHLRD